MVEPEATSAFPELDERFDRAVRAAVAGAARVSVLYSGGVDSTLVAMAAGSIVPVELVTIGWRGSRDLAVAPEAARSIALPIRTVPVSSEDLAEAQSAAPIDLMALREPARSVQLALAIAVRATPDRRVLTGQGADELFGGYAHFRGLDDRDRRDRRARDWAALGEVEWPRSVSVAESLGRELRAPFLEPAYASLALALPIPPIGHDGVTKPLLRAWALARGVPAPIALRPKVALQYGSGIAKAVRREG